MKVFTSCLVALALALPVFSATNSQPSAQPGSSCTDFECPSYDHSGRGRWNAGEYSGTSLYCKYQAGKGTVYACQYDSRGKKSGGVASCPDKGDQRRYKRRDNEPSPPQPAGKWSDSR